MRKRKGTFFFPPHQHMLEKQIILYSYIFHPTFESWHWERWFFSCHCVFYRLHNFWASSSSLLASESPQTQLCFLKCSSVLVFPYQIT